MIILCGTCITQVVSVLPKFDVINLKEMVKEAVQLGWNMVTLVPPAFICQPTEYQEDWHEKTVTYWTEDTPTNSLIYFRPVLFYSSLGSIGCKGVIGNQLVNNVTVLRHNSNIDNSR